MAKRLNMEELAFNAIHTKNVTPLYKVYAREKHINTRIDWFDVYKFFAPFVNNRARFMDILLNPKYKVWVGTPETIHEKRMSWIKQFRSEMSEKFTPYTKTPMIDKDANRLVFASPKYGLRDYNKFIAIPYKGNEALCDLLVRLGEKYIVPKSIDE